MTKRLDRLVVTGGKFLHVGYRLPPDALYDNEPRQERLSVPVYEVAAVYVTTGVRYEGWEGGNAPATLRIVFSNPQVEAVEVATTYATAMRHKAAICDAIFPGEG